MFNVRDYGAVGDGTTNDSSAIASALNDAIAAADGGGIYFPPGQYLTDEIVLSLDGLSIIAEGRGVRLLARANNQTIVRVAASYCRVQDLRILGNGFTGVRGIAIVPANETQTTVLTNTNFNSIDRITVSDCEEGLVLRAGPDVAGADSGCWYNSVSRFHALNCRRGIWLREPTESGGSPPNRNSFWAVRVGTTGAAPSGYGNVGVDITSGDTNTFFALSLEGIGLGSAPLASPTGLRVLAQDPLLGTNNDNNRFFGATFEACTRDIDNNNSRSEFFGVVADATKCVGTSPFGGITITRDVSRMPLMLPGLEYGEGISGVASAQWLLSKELNASAGVTAARLCHSTGLVALAPSAESSDISYPTRRPCLMTLTSNANPHQARIYLLTSDGSSAHNLTSIVDQTADTLSITSVMDSGTWRITNGTGSSCSITWSILVTTGAV